MTRDLPPPKAFLGRTLSRFPDHVIEQHIASGANGHLFRAHNPDTAGTLAYKFVRLDTLPPDSIQRTRYLEEAKRPNLLEHDAVVPSIDVVPYVSTDFDGEYVVFISQFVRGIDLKKYMASRGDAIDIPFIESFLRTMLEVLFELDELNLRHGDLHAGNVLVAKPKIDAYDRTRFKITDFGLSRPGGPTAAASDYERIAGTLRQLLSVVEYTSCTGRDRYVYLVLSNEFVGRHLMETDPSADPIALNPRGMLEKLDSLDAVFQEAKQVNVPTLVSPFDYPNCEQIGNAHLLLRNLYSDRLLGLEEIESRSNLVLTGPRGCGKTTVFRALSLEYLMSANEDDPRNMPYVGIYYRCDDLYFAFPRYVTPRRDEALDVPVHFLTVTLIADALGQVRRWGERHFERELKRQEEALVSDLWSLLGWEIPEHPSARRLPTLVNRLGKERQRAATKQRFVDVPTEPIQGYFGPDILFSVCRLMRERLSFMAERPVYFFIDDYSDPKIRTALQANLNRLLMHRSEHVFFKIATESPVSFAPEDVDGKRYVESREYDMVNLGLRYISDESGRVGEFLEDLFRRRFHEVEDYPVKDLENLLGSRPRNENETARDFRQRKGRESYSGVETIAAMCSGDVHYMIGLVGRIVADFGGRDALSGSEDVPRIRPRKQHESIRRASGDFMASIRTLPSCGEQLAKVVASFGAVARSYLLYETARNEAGEPPHQASRIEPYEGLDLSAEAHDCMTELRRYSIFVEDPRGRSRRGKSVGRLYLRRYLVPHFGLTFSLRDSLQLEGREIELLLKRPQEFERLKRLKSADDARRPTNGRGGRRSLFAEGQEDGEE